MRLPLATLEIFDAIAREGTLRAAAQRLGLQPSTVSHQLKTLERELGVSLFSRTTRRITLTDAGRALHRGTGPAFDQLTDSLQAARDTGESLSGSLRITMPEFAHEMFIAERLPEFARRYPDIELEISISETFVDLFAQEFHAGVRLGDRLDPDMIGVRLSPPMPVAVLASRDYLARHGQPDSPAELLNHSCIRYRFGSSQRIAPWRFSGDDGAYEIKVGGTLIVNTLPTLYQHIAAGMGLGYTFADYRPAGVAAKTIVPLLQQHIEPISGVFLYYPREYRSMALLRRFIEFFRLNDD